MAALNFPDSPSNGQKFIASNGVEYTYSSTNDTWTGALEEGAVPINPVPGNISATPDFAGGTGTESDPFIITPSVVTERGGTAQSEQYITITAGKLGDRVVFTNTTTPINIAPKYNQPMGLIDANNKWSGYLVYDDSNGAETTSQTTYTGKLKIGTETVYFQWDVTQYAAPEFVLDTGAVIGGNAAVGGTLTCSEPVVSGGTLPYTYTYQWSRSVQNSTFVDIASATAATYTPTAGDVALFVRCTATITDSTTPTAQVLTSVTSSVNIIDITISLSTLDPKVNETITAVATTVPSGKSLTYQWKADGVDILGATSATYTVELATEGKRLSCLVTADDNIGLDGFKESQETNPVIK